MTVFFEGQCSCGTGAIGTTVYEPSKSQVLASWRQPDFHCAAGADATVEDVIVNPPVTSPRYFPLGEHKIVYTYKLQGDVTLECPVSINLIGELQTSLKCIYTSL